MRLDWDWRFAASVLPQLVAALRITVLATILGSILALSIGLLFAIARRSRLPLVSTATVGVVEFVRSTPLLIQIYFLFYVMPRFGLRLSPLTTGVLVLGLHYGAYTAEVYRAGIDAVPRGQWEAAAALNLGARRTFLRIILPQALPPIVPTLGNYVIAMFKETPLLSTITVVEMLYAAKDIGSETFRYLEPFTLVGALFLAVSLVAAGLVRVVERRLPSFTT